MNARWATVEHFPQLCQTAADCGSKLILTDPYPGLFYRIHIQTYFHGTITGLILPDPQPDLFYRIQTYFTGSISRLILTDPYLDLFYQIHIWTYFNGSISRLILTVPCPDLF